MKKIINAAVVVCVSIALIYGCDSTNNPVSVGDPDVNRSVNGDVEISNTAVINNYNVELVERDFDGDRTTFHYKVTYGGNGPSSNNFYMEVPKCAVGSFDPSQFVSTREKPIEYPYIDERSQTTGILFKSSLSRKASNFAVSYSGNIPTGMIAATIESGNRSGTGTIAGPCKGAEDLIEISGIVFVDIVDEIGGNRDKDPFETGIYNVVVELQKGNESLVKRTDATGKFSFLVPAGSYTILIPETIDGVQFNEKFFETYNFAGFVDDFGATVPSKDISPTDDISIDFPFNADPDALIKGFEEKTILTNTRDAEFWRKMVQNAVNDSQGNFEVSKQEIYSLLRKIEDNDFFETFDGKDLLPAVPFDFGNGTDIERAAVALEYLFNPSESNKTPEQLFLKQLLAAEFNIASEKYGVGGFEVDSNDISLCPGGTIITMDGKYYCDANIVEFHLALLAFGEGIAATFPIIQKISASSISSTLTQSTAVFESFNRSGTGGLN